MLLWKYGLILTQDYEKFIALLEDFRTVKLTKEFKALWISINRTGVSYRDAKSLTIKKGGEYTGWKTGGISAKYGYASIFNFKDWTSDVSTFEGAIVDLRREEVHWHEEDAEFIKPYLDVYRKKALLLKNSGLITSEDYERFMKLMKKFE